MAKFIEDTSITAALSGFQLEDVLPNQDKKSSASQTDFTQIPLAIGLTGNLKALPDLITQLENSSRFIGIKSVNVLGKQDGTGKVTLNLVLFSAERGN